MKEDEMDGACGTGGGEEKFITEFLWGNPNGRCYLKELGSMEKNSMAYHKQDGKVYMY
jgi:hypothetical protein